jgi:multiple sugar transport system permease protein
MCLFKIVLVLTIRGDNLGNGDQGLQFMLPCPSLAGTIGDDQLSTPLENPKQTKWHKIAAYFVLWVWAVICVFPIYWVAVTSIKAVPDIEGLPKYLPFVDFSPSLDAWRFILFDHAENLVAKFWNSLIIASVATLLTLLTGTMLLYGLSRFRRTNRLLGFGIINIILATRILPPVIVALPLYLMAYATNMLDSAFAMTAIYAAVNLPIAIWFLQPAIGAKTTDQEEAALLDGASHFQICFGILLPMIKGSLIATGVIIFLMCWNEYIFAVYLTSDYAQTLPPWMVGQLSMKEAQVGGGAEEWAHLSAATIFMILPALALAAFVTKVFKRPD